MKVVVRVYGQMQDVLGKKNWFEMDIGESSSVNEVIERLGLRREWILTVLVNQTTSSFDSRLQEGDKVEFIPMIAGG